MTDGNAAWNGPDGESPRSLSRVTVIAGAAAGVLILSTIGAIGGWLLADPGRDDPSADAATSTSGPSTPATSPRSPSRTTAPAVTASPVRPSTTTARPRPAQFALPDVVGTDFEPGRRQLLALGLGVHLVFAESGDDRGVERTDPPAGAMLQRGVTVKVYVGGEAPDVSVPSVTGMSCGDAANLILDHGLYPEYPAGRAGRVVGQDPEPPREVRWNDRVKLFCGAAPIGSRTP